MPKFVFVILHYITIEETIKCIDSIKNKCKNSNYEIVVVDNGSANNTGLQLQKKYKKIKSVHIILSKENLGFSRGNNIGFEYAKNKLNADFIVMLNNDVYIIQDNFIEEVTNEYNNSNFAVLGPKIYLKDNKVCEYPDILESIKKLKQQRIENKILYCLNKIHLRYIYTGILKIKKKFIKQKKYDNSKRKEDVLLNGCCLIFSKKYIDKFDGIDDRPFLYYEEQLLYLRLKANNMKSVFTPKIVVFHDESVSTNTKTKNSRKRFDFVLKHEIDSLNILIKDMMQLEENK